MDWAGVLNNPFLRDLPFKIELNKWGKILMSPASNHHGMLQSEAVFFLRSKLAGGRVAQGRGRRLSGGCPHRSQPIGTSCAATHVPHFSQVYIGMRWPHQICLLIHQSWMFSSQWVNTFCQRAG